MKFPAYPKYKPSGVEWLGDVPKNWDVRRSDGIVESERRQLSPESFADKEVFHYSIPAVQEFGTGLAENGEDIASGKQVISEPVVLVSRLNPRKATICRAEPKKTLTLASTEFVALKAKRCDLRFLEYMVGSEIFRQRLDSWVQSVTRSHQRASPDQIYRFWNAWPSVAEQGVIADFLDARTARLDALLAKRRALIEKLQEKRTALISRTVTRGLNPNAKLKPSGVEWLGDIPETWNAKPLKYVATIKTGFAFSSDDFLDEGIPVLRIGEITRDGQVDMTYAKCLPIEYLQTNPDVIVRRGDIVMAMTGATIGKVGRYDLESPAFLNQRVCIFRRQAGNEQVFLWYLLNADFYFEHVMLTAFGGAQPNISDTELLACCVPVPPSDEQRGIAEFLDHETAKIDRMVETVEAAIGKLQEYRTALITAAVTGKIDVRKAAA